MQLDINQGTSEKIVVYEGDNLEEVKTIVLTKNDENVNLTGLTCDMAYVDAKDNSIGDLIENLNISNAEIGEISLPINSSLTKRNGTYDCELRLKNKTGYVKYTGFFNLIIKENIFNKIGNKILSNNSFSKIQEILNKADSCLKKLETFNTTDIENKIDKATELNKSLTSNVASVDSKNNMLKDSIKKAEDFSKTLTGGTDFVQMRKDIDTLESNLKSKQTLAYSGSNITCNNSLEGRTSNMNLKGRILQNVLLKGFNSKLAMSPTFNVQGTLLNAKGNNGYPALQYDYSLFKPNTKYTLFVDVLELNNILDKAWCIFRIGEGDMKLNTIVPNPTTTGLYRAVFTTPNIIKDAQTFMRPEAKELTVKLDKIRIIEGEIDYIDYFEGIQSVGNKEINLCEYMELGGVIYSSGEDYENNQYCRTSYIPVEKGMNYSVSPLNIPEISEAYSLYYYDKDKKWIDNLNTPINSKYNFFTAKATGYVRIEHRTLNDSVLDATVISKIRRQVNKGKNLLPYTEPFRVPVKYKSCGKNLFNPIVLKNRLKDNWYEFKAEGNTRTDAYFCIFTEKGVYPNSICYGVNTTKNEFTTSQQTKYYCCLGVNGDKKDDKEWVEITLKPNKKYTFSCNYYKEVNLVKYKDIQIEELTQTLFEPYKEYFKTILLPKGEFFGGLGTTQEIIKEEDNKVVLYKNVKKKILSNTDDWNLDISTLKNTVVFYLNSLENAVYGIDKELNVLSSIKTSDVYNGKDEECIRLGRNSVGLYIRVRKDRLKEVTVQGWKDYLKDNPIPVYYQVDKPYKIDLGVIETDVDTYEDTTHIMSLNSIPATLDFSIATNYGSVLNQHSQEINNLWNTINKVLVPALIDTNKNMALKAIENNL